MSLGSIRLSVPIARLCNRPETRLTRAQTLSKLTLPPPFLRKYPLKPYPAAPEALEPTIRARTTLASSSRASCVFSSSASGPTFGTCNMPVIRFLPPSRSRADRSVWLD
jgi:hypothetical protein